MGGAFPSSTRSILAEIYLRHACSCPERWTFSSPSQIEDRNARAGQATGATLWRMLDYLNYLLFVAALALEGYARLLLLDALDAVSALAAADAPGVDVSAVVP
eukprot:COSAG01_NODE_1186_length_11341_cov_3.330635_4_plen_103_part_00